MEKQPLPTRKNIRWDKQDYSRPCEYMITVCTKDMKQILSKIVCVNERTLRYDDTHGNSITVGDDVLVVPRIELTYYGKIADKYINQLNNFYKNINVIKYVIMPNHIHLLLQIPDGTTGTSSPTGEQTDVTNGEKTSFPTNKPTDARPVEHSVIADFVSTFKRFCNKEYSENIWQRSYHDHVIRNENDFIGAVSYIENNPARWISGEDTQ